MKISRQTIASAVLMLIITAFRCTAEETSMKTEPVKIGDIANGISLKDQKGEEVSLSDFRGKQNVVLYFYPKDDTPGCTKEACTFRDSFEVFQDEGAVVIGVSSDSVESHKAFAEKYNLPFTLLSDTDGKIRELYGVPSTMGLPGRVTYVIDKEGVVRHMFSSMMKAKKHIDEALTALKELD